MKIVFKQIWFVGRLFLNFLVQFLVMRLLFALFNSKSTIDYSFDELLTAFAYGLKLDVSAAGYTTILPLLLWLLFSLTKANVFKYAYSVYVWLVSSLVLLISFIDAQLYEFWGQKLNAYAASFANFTSDMVSFSSGLSYGKIIFFIPLFILFVKFCNQNIPGRFDKIALNKPLAWQTLVAFLVSLVWLFLGIRGGIGMAAMNQSFAYHSNKPFLNHLALNTCWNFAESLINEPVHAKSNPYTYKTQAEAEMLVKHWFDKGKQTTTQWLSTVNNPNILVVILEGWSADVVAAAGGEPDVTTRLNALAQQGLFFDAFYANGNRTDKGLSCIISGQPAFATTSIINNINKFTNMPSIVNQLATKNYQSAFVYGGELEFANMRAYLLNAGYNKLYDIHDFNAAVVPESWGVHDEFMFDKLLDVTNNTKTPWLVTALTLSSHEPYKVPHESKFVGNTQADLYRNAVHYSDECLGDFLDEAKKQPWYNQTLIFVLSDHGHQEPKGRLASQPQRFHIPFLITGGALNQQWQGKVVSRVSQQTDFASGLMQQLHLSDTAFKWSNNLFSYHKPQIATYTFTDGIGLVSDKGNLVFDQLSKKSIQSTIQDSLAELEKLRAYHHLIYQEYITR